MSLSITIIQTNIIWENIEANLVQLEEKINAITVRTELIILPEMFSTGFSMHTEKTVETMEGKAVQWMKRIAAKKKVIITGSLAIKEDGNCFNRLLWVLPNGQVSYYDKRHLFSYGQEDKHFTAGNKRLIAQVKGFKINLQICYDLRFPVWARQQTNDKGEAEYDVLIYVANWSEQRSSIWKTLLAARAIENQCYVVGVNRVGIDGNHLNYSGDSCLVSPLGEVMYTKSNEEDVHTFTIEKEDLTSIRQKFPFLKDADDFFLPKN